MADLDCLICGSCVVDLLCRPIRLDKPIGYDALRETEPVVLTGGGITSNTGVTMARMGMKIGVLTYVGDDEWAPVIRNLLRFEGIDDGAVVTHPTEATSTTVVAVDEQGERSFFHCVGAPKAIDTKFVLEHLDWISRSRIFLVGYYSLMSKLEPDLPEIFKRVRETGCQTGMDSAGHGGTMDPLEKILPQLDVWVPSFNEAKNQTGHDDPSKILTTYRSCGAPGLLGVKLGREGVLLSPKDGTFLEIAVAKPPGEVIDTTGAGDAFYAGLLTGLLKGMSVEDAGKLGAGAGACCCTAVGGSTGGRDYAFTAKVAGLG